MLRINMEFRKGILFVRLVGKLNHDTSYRLDEFLVKTINKHGIKNMVINLDNLYSLDAEGNKVLKRASDAIKKNKGKSFVCSSSKTINLDYSIKKFLVKNELTAMKILNV